MVETLKKKTAGMFGGWGRREKAPGPRFDFAEFFGNRNPVEVDIGCGKGKYLLGRAQETSAINFLGIDRVGKWMNVGRKRGEKRGLDHLKFLKAEVREWLERLDGESVSVFHVYFPDPWPKRRHRKRRLVNEAFLKLLYSKLRRQGRLEIATDDPDYFVFIKEEVAKASLGWAVRRESRNERIADPEIKTNYELKWAADGRTLFYLELFKP